MISWIHSASLCQTPFAYVARWAISCICLFSVLNIRTCRDNRCYLYHPHSVLQFVLYWTAVCCGCDTTSIGGWRCLHTCEAGVAIFIHPLTYGIVESVYGFAIEHYGFCRQDTFVSVYTDKIWTSAGYTDVAAEYDWAELWRAVIGLLGFLSNKLDSLMTTGGVERLAQEVSKCRWCLLLLTRLL